MDGLATGLWIFLLSSLVFGFVQRRVMRRLHAQGMVIPFPLSGSLKPKPYA
jgi:hypothetical protein